MSAFDAGRVGLWIVSPSKLDETRLTNIRNYSFGMFTDVFLPPSAGQLKFKWVRSFTSGAVKSQLREQPFSLETAEDFATRVHRDISNLAPYVGVVDWD